MRYPVDFYILLNFPSKLAEREEVSGLSYLKIMKIAME